MSVKVKNRDLVVELLKSPDKNVDCLLKFFSEKFSIEDEHLPSIERKLSQTFMNVFKKKWADCHRIRERFLNSNEFWLDDCYFEWAPSDSSASTLGTGRPRKEFDSLSESSKRRRSAELANMYSCEELALALQSKLRAEGKKEIGESIRNLLAENITDEDEDEEESEPSVLTKEEALALYFEVGLTRSQYEKIRAVLKKKLCLVFPAYNKLQKAKKDCYPAVINVTEEAARIPLQSLCDTTAQRLVAGLALKEKLPPYSDLILSWKWGCDGASSQSIYKQVFSDGNTSDENVFMFSAVPLQMVSSDGLKCWVNPRPCSTRMCRPISFAFAKETPTRVLNDVESVKSEIENLATTSVKINDICFTVQHELHLTMIDGKIRQFITDTASSSSCCLCGAKPTEMNCLSALKLKAIKDTSAAYGMSTLHAWIRFMECILHIGYRLPFEKWSARSAEDKALKEVTKKRIQKNLKARLGIAVDLPKHGAGSTNDGNTARRFFKSWKVAAEETGVNEDLIHRFYIVLQVLASGHSIDSTKFEKYCWETYELYLSKYSWYYMPSSVHMILLHGKILLDSAPMPIGWMSEEAQESRNKDFRRFRLNNSRKCSRISTNEDIINNLLVSSDPLISSLRPQWKSNPVDLEIEAQQLLLSIRDEDIITDDYDDHADEDQPERDDKWADPMDVD